MENMIRNIKKKDLYTHEHNTRLHDYSIKLAKKFDLSEERVERLAYAALFHDIGKINVPDYVLQKPGALNEEEFNYIKMHPTDGRNIISQINISCVGDIIEQHHERLDGSGYPYGLKGDQILWEAKVIAVADSYDAMTTDRPYRKAMAPDKAMQELERLAGTHYEKDVVDVFKDLLIDQGVLKTNMS